MGTDEPPSNSWTFLTNHGHVLLALHRNPDLRQRDLAWMVGITEGAVQRILAELHDCGYVEIERVGRRNHYRIDATGSLRHPIEANHSVGELLERLGPAVPDGEAQQRPAHEERAA